MSKWVEKSLSDVAEVIMGQSPPSNTYTEEEVGLPFLQGSAEFGQRHPIAQVFCRTPLKVAPNGSVLISVRAPVGAMNRADQEYCIGRGLGSIQGTGASTDYLYQVLHLHIEGLNRRAQGSTFTAITGTELKRYKLLLPEDSVVQRTIAHILSTIDALIDQTETLIEKQRQIKQGMLHDLFTRGVDAKGQLRPPQSEAPELYKETKLGWVPKEWKVVRLNAVLEQGRPLTYGIVQPGPYVDNGVPMIRSQDYTTGWNPVESVKKVSALIDTPYERSRVYENDILITVVGANVGRMALVPATLDGANISRSVARVAVAKDTYSTRFIYFCLQVAVPDLLFKNQVGGAQPVINLKDLNDFEFALPDLKEQGAIATLMQCVIDYGGILSEELAKLESIKAGLMHSLLTGQVPVEDLLELPSEKVEPAASHG